VSNLGHARDEEKKAGHGEGDDQEVDSLLAQVDEESARMMKIEDIKAKASHSNAMHLV